MENFEKRVKDFFLDHAQENLNVVFVPVESTLEGKFAFKAVLRVYAFEIYIPTPPFSKKIVANAWVPDSNPVYPDCEYTADVRHRVGTEGAVGWQESHNGVPVRWFVSENHVRTGQPALQDCSLFEQLERSIPIELFFVHNSDTLKEWQALRQETVLDYAEALLEDMTAEDGRRYY